MQPQIICTMSKQLPLLIDNPTINQFRSYNIDFISDSYNPNIQQCATTSLHFPSFSFNFSFQMGLHDKGLTTRFFASMDSEPHTR